LAITFAYPGSSCQRPDTLRRFDAAKIDEVIHHHDMNPFCEDASESPVRPSVPADTRAATLAIIQRRDKCPCSTATSVTPHGDMAASSG
jgi:hypothetical protein